MSSVSSSDILNMADSHLDFASVRRTEKGEGFWKKYVRYGEGVQQNRTKAYKGEGVQNINFWEYILFEWPLGQKRGDFTYKTSIFQLLKS